MKKVKNELSRIQSVIIEDRMNTDDRFTELFVYDLNKLLKDYFDFKGYPKVSIAKESGGFNVDISFSAMSLKPFSSIPNEENCII